MNSSSSTETNLYPSGPQCADGRASPKIVQSSDEHLGGEKDWIGIKESGRMSSLSSYFLAENVVSIAHILNSLESLILMLGSDAVINEDGEYVSRTSPIVLSLKFLMPRI